MGLFSLTGVLGALSERKARKEQEFQEEVEAAGKFLEKARDAGNLDGSLSHLRAYKAFVDQSSFKKRHGDNAVQQVIAEYVIKRAKIRYLEDLPSPVVLLGDDVPDFLPSRDPHKLDVADSFWYAANTRQHRDVKQLYEQIDDVVNNEFEPRVNGLMNVRKVKRFAVDQAYGAIQLALVEDATEEDQGFASLEIAAKYEQLSKVYAKALGCNVEGVPQPKNGPQVVYGKAMTQLFNQLESAVEMDAEMLNAGPTHEWFEEGVTTLRRYIDRANRTFMDYQSAEELRARVSGIVGERDQKVAELYRSVEAAQAVAVNA